MSDATPRAVFLSYASQDTAAALRICEALRAAGVEVWFDRSELRGGDTWDHKIRKQIKECALFVPIISANTNSRPEGYFRLEWKLAVDRSHLLADDHAFLFPVVIDETAESTARVPEKFRDVQWTRLNVKETPETLARRVGKLLDREESTERSDWTGGGPTRTRREKQPPWLRYAWMVVGLMFAVIFAVRPLWQSRRRSPEDIAKIVSDAQAMAANASKLSTPSSPENAAAQPQLSPPAKAKPVVASPVPEDEKSVAVLAFTNLSDDKGNEYFSDGISEELLNVLAKVPGLKVSARTSAFYFKDKQVPVGEIARQLGVAYVVEGSVRKAGDKVRITAELVKAADGFQVWSDTFTRDLKDIFAVQDEIAGLVAKNLELKLGTTARVTASIDPEAYRLYLQGRQALQRRTEEGFDQAAKLFNEARAIAPEWAPLYAGLADAGRLRVTTTLAFGPGAAWSPELKNSQALAERAMALDPNLPEAYVALGGVYMQGSNLPESERLIHRALELNPNQADAYLVLGRLQAAQGRMDEAIAAFQRAAELNPLAPRILDNFAAELGMAGRYTEGMSVIERALALQPDSVQILCFRARLLANLGRRDEALQQARQLAANSTSLESDFCALEASGVYMAFGHQAEAEALAAKISPLGSEKVISFAYLGRPAEALPLLGQVNFNWIEDLLWGRGFDPIRQDPRYQAYLAKVGLIEADARARAWRAAHPAEKH